jgi:23S rRNA (adenine2030-N6)-methyltransferase
MRYNHRNHAGNAGDVWKHFILAEVAEYLLTKENKLVYVESHVGYPEYVLERPGEWQDGVERCWNRLNALREFSYFDILDKMNPSGLRNYPGSGLIVLMAAAKSGSRLEADVWDVNPEVEASWRDVPLLKSKFSFHLGDGFSGLGSLLGRSRSALLLIDPTYLEIGDDERAMDLLERSASSGWTVLWWRMRKGDVMPEICCDAEFYSVNFSDVGMSCGKWRGATMTLAGSDDLLDYLKERARNFLRIMRYPEPIKDPEPCFLKGGRWFA